LLVLGLGTAVYAWRLQAQRESRRPLAHAVTAATTPAVSAPRTTAQPIEAPPILTEIDWASLCRPAPQRPAGPSVVHRWTDADGVLHYSSTAPPQGARDAARIEAKVPIGAQVEVAGLDAPLAPGAREELRTDVLAVLAIMERALGVTLDRAMRIDALVVADPVAFAALRGDMLPSQGSIGGFYSARDRRLVVQRAPRAELTRAMLRHEAVHAIAHEAIGPLPMWLNEGLAEYFERLDPRAGGARVGAAGEWLLLLDAMALDERLALFDRALAAEHDGFHGPEHEAMYAAAWALVSYLMGDAERRAQLRRLLEAQRRTPGCRPADLRLALDAIAPGRLDGFLVDVARWVETDARAPQAF
jgi:hypothetical protein